MTALLPAVKIQNFGPAPLRQWVLIGLPDPVPAQAVRVGPWLGYAKGHELHVLADLPAATDQTHEIVAASEPLAPYAFHEWVADDLLGLVPVFHIVVGGTKHSMAAIVEVSEFTPVLLKVQLRARLPGPVSIEGWYRMYSGSPIVEFELTARYGTTTPGQPRVRGFGSLSMSLADYAHVDFGTTKGLHAPAWSMIGGVLRWEMELCAPMEWHRAAVVEATGAVLCLPNVARFPSLPGNAEVGHLQVRMFAPLEGIVVPTAWAGKLTPLGVLPELPIGAQGEQARRLSILADRLTRTGSEQDARPYAQPPNAGQTGEQPDFGYARAEHAVAMGAPWALWDLRFAVQAWKLRPYSNVEPNIDAVTAAGHPRANTYNLRVDERFSRDDMLGWPNPVGWISGYLTSDSQHRSDNLLFAMFKLTRSDSLRRTILDLLELERMEVGRDRVPALGSGMGAPRGWGRVLYSRLQAINAGFPEFEPLARRMVTNANLAASYNKLPTTASVRVFSDQEEKYGWLDGSGERIRCWLPWQEAIAVVALYAAWRLLGIPQARDLALTAARTICMHGYFQVGTDWRTCYGVRWRTDAPGEPLPASSYNLSQPNFDVFLAGMQRWQNPALKVLLALEPDGLVADRARQILANYGPPKSWDDACWGAV